MSEMPTIMEFSEDISKAEAPDPLPVGEYVGQIRSVELKNSQAGNIYASIMFFVEPDQYPADFDAVNAPDGLSLPFNRVVMKDDAASRHRLRRFIEAIGGKAGKSIDVNDWIGLTGTLEVEHDEYEGVTRAQIKRVKEGA